MEKIPRVTVAAAASSSPPATCCAHMPHIMLILTQRLYVGSCRALYLYCIQQTSNLLPTETETVRNYQQIQQKVRL
jgi:hypothetical protein